MISRIVEQSEEQQQLHLSILDLVDFGSHGFHQPVELSHTLVVYCHVRHLSTDYYLKDNVRLLTCINNLMPRLNGIRIC